MHNASPELASPSLLAGSWSRETVASGRCDCSAGLFGEEDTCRLALCSADIEGPATLLARGAPALGLLKPYLKRLPGLPDICSWSGKLTGVTHYACLQPALTRSRVSESSSRLPALGRNSKYDEYAQGAGSSQELSPRGIGAGCRTLGSASVYAAGILQDVFMNLRKGAARR